MNRGLKIAVILPLSALSIAVLAVWSTGNLFPWIPLVSTVSVLGLGYLLPYLDSRDAFQTGVIGAIAIGTGLRLIIFHTPAGLVGNDPDKFALLAHLTLLTGDSTFESISFYGVFGGFHTLIAETAAVTGMNTTTAMQIFPILFGITVPLLAASFTLHFLKSGPTARLGGGLAALLGAVSTMGVSISYWAVAQTMGVFLFFVLVLVIINWDSKHHDQFIIVSFILALGLLISHKLTLAVSLIIITAVWAMDSIALREPGRFRWGVQSSQLPAGIVVVFAILTGIQMAIMTNYLSRAVVLTQSVLFRAGSIPTRRGEHPAAAVVPDPGYMSIFFHKSHAIILLLVSGIVWVIASIWTLKKRSVLHSRMSFLLVISVIVGFIGLSLGGALSRAGIQPMRFFALVEVLLVSLISIGAMLVYKRQGIRRDAVRSLAVTILIVLLLSQTFSASALPDYPGQSREYLTEDEVSAKMFASNYFNSVATDVSLRREVVDQDRVTSKDADEVVLGRRPRGDQFSGWNYALLNGNPESVDRAILYRDVQIYGSVSSFANYRYKLQWDPNTELGKQRGQVYSNGGASIYTR
ncbi:hypothetical protein PNQ29_03235 [Halobacterium salinarum]|uniref:hypothetical protein n=1 Tax=Halobacterium salinarum TaxID=2242 RepID=UPI002557B6D7|nr:hypothetical protein [Halobacterium salinarum]MDL0118518.1 hypothetical protein [Halobacterium salinarum]MDL0118731.1 hypothetical protein [Halobacterium salinarum]MDL0118757.1 hypothetical protein [Halobacterium salinarum]